MGNDDLTSDLAKIAGRVAGPPCPTCGREQKDLVINKVPGETKRAFKDLAEAEFMGHYGFTLKWLMDVVPEINRTLALISELNGRVSDVERGIASLAKQPTEEKPPVKKGGIVKIVDGKV